MSLTDRDRSTAHAQLQVFLPGASRHASPPLHPFPGSYDGSHIARSTAELTQVIHKHSPVRMYTFMYSTVVTGQRSVKAPRRKCYKHLQESEI